MDSTVTVPLLQWPGQGEPTIVCAHATGFSKELWRPFADEFRRAGGTVPVVAFDFQSHGEARKLAHPVDWWAFAGDVDGALSSVSGTVVGLGHSMGAAALIMRELLHPGTFSALVLVEPIVLPDEVNRRFSEHNPLAAMAMRRRRTFPSAEAAHTNFASKPVFGRWDGRALSAYVEGGLIDEEVHWRLACEPEDEAATFRAAATTGLWDRLGEVRCPVTVVGGEHSDSHSVDFVEILSRRFVDGSVHIVPGATHFVPMEAPGDLAELMLERLADD